MTSKTKSLQLTEAEMEQRIREYIEERDSGTLSTCNNAEEVQEHMAELAKRDV